MWIIVHKLNLVHQSLSGKELEYEPGGNSVVHRGTGKTMNMRFGKIILEVLNILKSKTGGNF